MKAAEVFVSHASEDAGAATAVCSALEGAGLTCWIAPRDVDAGRDYAEQIVDAIAGTRLMVVVLSAAANESPHVRREVERAVSSDRPVLPVRVADVVPSASLAYFLSSTHWLDAADGPLADRLPDLITAVRRLLGGSGTVSGPTAPPSPVRTGDRVSPRTRAMVPATLQAGGALPFVGRGHELGRLVASWGDAVEGRPRVVAVAGEPGIGKTRLLSEFAGQVAVPGVAVLYGRAEEGLGVPYGPFVEALGGYVGATDAADLKAELGPLGGELARLVPGLEAEVPGLGPPIRAEPETERFRLLQSVVEFLTGAAARGPVLVVLDDLHWATAADALMLSHLLRSTPEAALMVVLAYRDTEIDSGHPLEPVLAELARLPGGERIHLGGLECSEVQELVSSRVAGGAAGSDRTSPLLGQEVHDQTAGNPFFIGEVLRDLAERHDGADRAPVPSEGVRAVVARRVARLPVGSEDVLTTAALIGARFDLPLLLAAVADQAVCLEVLASAEAAGLVTPDPVEPGTYRFAHALVRATLQDGLPLARRAVLHLQLGRALEELTGGRSRLGELSLHFIGAAPLGESERAVRYARRAGEDARDALDFERAARYFRQALELADPGGSGRSLDLEVDLGDMLHRAGDPAHRQVLEHAARTAQKQGDSELLARAALAMGLRGTSSADLYAEGLIVEATSAALAGLPSDDSELRARLTSQLAVELTYSSGTDQRRRRLSDDAIAMARRLGDPACLAWVLAAHYEAVQWAGNMQERVTIADELRSLDDAGNDPEAAVHGLLFRASCAIELLQLDDATVLVAQAEEMLVQLPQPLYRMLALTLRASLRSVRGEFAAADRLIDQLLAETEGREPALRRNTEGLLLQQLLTRGDDLSGIADLLAGRADTEPSPEWGVVLAVVYCESDAPDLARPLLERYLSDRFDCVPRNGLWSLIIGLLGLVSHRLRDERAADLVAELLSPFRGRLATNGQVSFGPVDLALARAADVLDETDAARSAYAEAAAICEAIGNTGWLARTLWDHARLLGRTGERSAAEGRLQAALTVADGAGLDHLAARIRETPYGTPG